MAVYDKAHPRAQRHRERASSIRSTTVLAVRRDGHVVHRRRRPGDDGQHRRQGDRAQDPPPARRQGPRRLRGLAPPTASRCSRSSRRKLKEYGGNLHARRRRAGQGLAHRPRAAPAGGAAAGRRPREDAAAVRAPATSSSRTATPRRSARAAPTRWRRRARCWARPTLPAREIAERALAIAGDICIYTNGKLRVRGAVRVTASPPTPKRAAGSDAARDRRGAGPLHRRPEGGQARGRDRAAQPLAAAAGAAADARRDRAQEHHAHRPDRRRQDRDRAPAGASWRARRSSRSRPRSSPRSATSGATSTRWCATWPRPRCRCCATRSASALRPRARENAEERLLDVLLPPRAARARPPGRARTRSSSPAPRRAAPPPEPPRRQRHAREPAPPAARGEARRPDGRDRHRGRAAVVHRRLLGHRAWKRWC